VPPELHHQLLEAASRLHVTPSEIVATAIRQYLEKLQAPDGNIKTTDILDRLERLERRIEALESVNSRHGATLTQTDTMSFPFLRTWQLVTRMIGMGSNRDPSTGKHFRWMELLASLQRMLGKEQPVSGVGSVSPVEGSLEANPAKPSVRVSGTESEYSR